MGKILKGENLEAEKLTKWLRMRGYIFSHCPNESGIGGKVAMIANLRKQRMGLSPGYPDYHIILKRGSHLFIELKKPRTKKKNGEHKALSSDGIDIKPEQEKWIEELNKINNTEACFCFGFIEAMQKILELEN